MPAYLPHAAAVAGLLPLLFAACSTPASGAGGMCSIADGETFAMDSGEQTAIADRSTLRYVRVTNDSRCKPDPPCVVARAAEVDFEGTEEAAGAPEGIGRSTARERGAHDV